MRFARLGEPGVEIPVVDDEGSTFDLRPLTADIDADFLAADPTAEVRRALHDRILDPVSAGMRFGPPIARPGKIVCIGLNYRDHAEETGASIPSEPIVFLKDPSTIVGPFDDVLIPRRSTKTDWEVELGVVIGRTARYLDSVESAAEAISGYVLSHDVSEREFQLERGGQWDKGKSCETFNPLGPYLVPAREMPDPQSLAMRLDVNGIRRQDGTTADMIFPVVEIVRYLSQFMVLHPGDLINTGTPAGVALGDPAATYLRPGDVVDLEIEHLGSARQRCVAA